MYLTGLNPLRIFDRRDISIKSKVSSAIKEIELHKRELENLRLRLEQRRRAFFETTVRAMQCKDISKASIYAKEWAELRKVSKVVYASELALTQVILRLESIVEIGDVIAHMSTAFKILRKVSKSVQGLLPSIDQASSEINSTLVETMAEMGSMAPTISLDLNTESGEELIEQARKYAEQRADELKRQLNLSPRVIMREAKEMGQKFPLLATDDYIDDIPIGTLYSQVGERETEEKVLSYALNHNGSVDVNDASISLRIPSDEVENAMLKLISEGKIKLNGGGEDKD